LKFLRNGLVILLVLLPLSTWIQAAPVTELTAKLALVRNMILFTDWPDNEKRLRKIERFHFCTYRDFATYRDIQRVFADSQKKILLKNKPVVVENKEKPEQLKSCHAVYLSKLSRKELDAVLALRAPNGPLLFGSHKGWGEAGVHFNIFLKPDRRLGFELNMRAMEITGHSPRFQLLNFARVLDRERRQ